MEQFATAILNAKAIGACEVYTNLIELEYQQLVAELED